MANADAKLDAKVRNKGGRPRSWDALRQHMKLRAMVEAAQDDMTAAQIAAAKGYKYLVSRSKKGGQFKPVTQEQLDQGILADDEVIIEVWDKQPSTPAFDSLMDRALGRPKETLDATVTHEAGPVLARIWGGDKRLSGK